MRTRKQIENDPKSYERLQMEVLLDIRELLAKRPATKKIVKKKAPSAKTQ
jgi:hypothetical protein